MTYTSISDPRQEFVGFVPTSTREEDDRHEPITVVVVDIGIKAWNFELVLPTQITTSTRNYHPSNILNLGRHRPKGWFKNEY
jgi:hypothetical protein